MNMLKLAAIAAGTVCLVPLTAAIGQEEVVVTGYPSIERWSAKTSHELERHLVYPRQLFGQAYPEGVATVHFTCGEDGRPANAVIAHSTGDRRLDRAAMSAVEQIDTLHPLPQRAVANQRFAALILFADSPMSLERQMRRIGLNAQRENKAWYASHSASGAGVQTAAMIDLLPAG